MAILDDTRSDWHARSPNGTLRVVPWLQRVGVSWHWIGPGRGIPATSSHTLCLDLVNRWQAQHQSQGWKDIGYNALICQHARAIEGRGLDKAGSHSPGVNWEHVGIQYMVGDLSPHPTTAMTSRAQRLRADLSTLGRNIRRDWGHRDDPEASTSCPGSWIETWVKVGGPTASPPTPPLGPNDPNWSEKMTRDELKAAVREVLHEKDTARYLFTGHPIMDNPQNPDPNAPRVAPSSVMETAAVASLEAAKNTRPAG